MRKGDILIVRKLDRPGRSLSQLEAAAGQFEEEGFGFRSFTEGITAAGTPVFHAMISHDVLEGNGPQAVFKSACSERWTCNGQPSGYRVPDVREPRLRTMRPCRRMRSMNLCVTRTYERAIRRLLPEDALGEMEAAIVAAPEAAPASVRSTAPGQRRIAANRESTEDRSSVPAAGCLTLPQTTLGTAASSWF